MFFALCSHRASSFFDVCFASRGLRTPDRLTSLGDGLLSAIESRIDWQVLMGRRPYDTLQRSERLSVYSDVRAMSTAYLVFTIEPVVGDSRADSQRIWSIYPTLISP